MASTTLHNSYLPDYLVTPGEVLESYLEDFAMSPEDLAACTGLALEHIQAILNAEAAINADIAHRLEPWFHRSANFWQRLEENYQRDKARLMPNS